MGKDVRKLFEFSWKTYGIISGWLLIALSIGQTLLFYSQRSQSDFFYYGTIAYVGKYDWVLHSHTIVRRSTLILNLKSQFN